MRTCEEEGAKLRRRNLYDRPGELWQSSHNRTIRNGNTDACSFLVKNKRHIVMVHGLIVALLQFPNTSKLVSSSLSCNNISRKGNGGKRTTFNRPSLVVARSALPASPRTTTFSTTSAMLCRSAAVQLERLYWGAQPQASNL